MRNIAWIVILIVVGCRKESGLSVKPSQLIGTWNSLSTLSSANEKPFVRWTFKPDYVHTLEDTSKACQPLNNEHYYKYWIEEDILVMRYEGISNGLFPMPDIRRHIISITATEVVLDTPRQILEKCP